MREEDRELKRVGVPRKKNGGGRRSEEKVEAV